MLRFALATAFALALPVGLYLSPWVVPEHDPRLTQVAMEQRWRGQPLTGVLLAWHGFGRLAHFATFVQGKPHGWDVRWHPNGMLEQIKHFRYGVYDGEAQSWYENGRIKTSRTYTLGLAEGEQWAFWPDGQVQEYNRYERDRLIAHKTWTFDGKPFHTYVFQDGETVGIMGEPFCKRRRSL